MATFPTLNSGAVAQYPLVTATRYSTQAVRFLDGSRQTFRMFGAGLRRWNVNLDLLDDRERSGLVSFVEQQGSATFAFTDPVSGNNVPKCVISGDSFNSVVKGEMRGQTALTIEEVL